VGSFLRPVGPLSPAVYWRRRILVFGIPLIVLIALVAYACSGQGPGPGPNAGGVSPTSSPTGGIITPGPVPTGSLPPINSYPVTGPTGSGTPTSTSGSGGGNGGAGGAGGAAGGNGGGSGSGGVGGTGSVPVGSSGCVLSVTVQLDKSATNGQAVYASGQNPTFNVILHNVGTENCLFDISGKGVVVTVTRVDTGAQVWTSATCAGAQDRRVLGPGDGATDPVKWDREISVSNCPTNPPTVGAGSYAVTATVSGVSSASVQFALQ
jgi:hypothetical protein